MTLTLEVPPEREAALRAHAHAQGMSVEQWFLEFSEHLAPATSVAHLQKTDPERWIKLFHTWAEDHDRATPLLSDDDVSRESIY